MKQHLGKFFLSSALLLATATGFSQSDWNHIGEDDIVSRDSMTKKGYTLVFISKDPQLDPQVKKRMIDAFFEVYPKEAKTYNKKTLKKVFFIVDPQYKGVAATAGSIVRFSPSWLHQHPGDIDVVTHEVMHIVQAYPGGAGPGWITEGIADYVRYTMGVDNKGAGWSLPAYSPAQNYDNAYRVTARFLVWIEKNGHKGFVKKLDHAMRTKTYKSDFWKNETGKTVDELWKAYSENPAI